MTANLPDELLKTIQQYCIYIDWKCLMDTSNALFRDLKYQTIDIVVDFAILNDRVLPSIAKKLMKASNKLHLYLDTENSLIIYDDAVEVKTSWEHLGKWRTTNLTH